MARVRLSVHDRGRRRTARLQSKLASKAGKATARSCAVRFAALLLAVLVSFSVSSSGAGHAHAALGAHVPTHHAEASAGKAHTHPAHAKAAGCDDSSADEAGQGNCCISASCGFCAPLPSAELEFLAQHMPAAFADSPASPSREPPTLRRPPNLSVTA